MPELSTKLGAKPGTEVLVFFTTSRVELERRFAALKATLAPADGLWIAWPKKAAKLDTDLDFDAVQRTGLAHGLVDNKSASIDETWQALRFVYRRRPPSRAQAGRLRSRSLPGDGATDWLEAATGCRDSE